jgi:hypothetical protein
MTTNSPVILDKPEDWPIWIEDIRGLTPDNIWPHTGFGQELLKSVSISLLIPPS